MTARPSPAVRLVAVAALCAAACVLAGPAAAQGAPLSLVNDETQVGTVGFRFVDTRTLDVAQLRLQIATKQPGLVARIKRRVGFGDPGVFPFRPVEVQKDVVRLRRYYARNGFPRAEVDYEARLDSSRNLASVTFVIAEGPPRLIEALEFAGPGQRPVEEQLDPDLHEDWARFTEGTVLGPGDRLDVASLVLLRSETAGWLRARGYAFADAGTERFLDSTGLGADIRIKVDAGPRARYGSIEVEGAEGLDTDVVLRELPFAPGDRFDARELGEGQRELFGLGLFQLALVETIDGQPRDSTVEVRVRLRRGPSRVLTGFLGYYSDGGVTGRSQVTHRNLLGGAQELSGNLEWRTGILGRKGQAVSGGPIRDFRASVALRQPYVF
ncbi:MAG TPA: POTRA domain-containing protein, partial [Rubricoccaceae bacterium]